MLGNLSEDYEMTTLIADLTTRFALTKRLRLRGTFFVDSLVFKPPYLGGFFMSKIPQGQFWR